MKNSESMFTSFSSCLQDKWEIRVTNRAYCEYIFNANCMQFPFRNIFKITCCLEGLAWSGGEKLS